MARCNRCNKFMLKATVSGYCQACEALVKKEADEAEKKRIEKQRLQELRRKEAEQKRIEEQLNRDKELQRKKEENDNFTFFELDNENVSIEKYTGTSSVVEIPSSASGLKIIAIGKEAFQGCETLTTVTIPDTIASIGDCAFFQCKNITSFNLPNTIEYIGSDAFGWCTSLREISIPDNLKNVGSNPFTECSKLVKINVSVSNENFATINNVLFNKKKKSVVTFPACVCSTYEIPNGIKEIGASAFMGCYTLKKVLIPKTVTVIRNSAFSWCNGLETIEIPEGVSVIENRAFFKCGQLHTITLPSSIKVLGENIFNDCSRDLHIVIKQNPYVEEYCKVNGLHFTNIANTSWLTE